MSQAYFFNTVHLLPEDLRFEHGGAKLASCPGHHLNSLRPMHTGPSTARLRYLSRRGRLTARVLNAHMLRVPRMANYGLPAGEVLAPAVPAGK